MIEFQNVSFNLNDNVILNDVSMKIEKGLNTVVLGPSGAGKSSILKIILGLWTPDKGRILYEGKDTGEMTNALFDSLTVAENILYFRADKKKLSEKELNNIVDEILSFVNLSGTENLYPEDLSGGMKKRVSIARALAINPKIILLDEPTTGLDPINTISILELIEKFKSNGTTSVVVTHILDDAIEVGDNFIMINQGSIEEAGDIRHILKTENKFVKDFFRRLTQEKHNPFLKLSKEVI
jgi:phospholipid/cholesterol/gamma-HCH transport system ATP-binding protein